MSEYTKGPWHTEYSEADHTQRWEVFGQGEDEWVADCGVGGNSEQCARLIAAAPELLEDAEATVQGYHWLIDRMGDVRLYGGAWTCDEMEAWALSIEAHIRSRRIGTMEAIAKATGGAK